MEVDVGVVSLACALRGEFVKEVIEFTLGVAVAPRFLLIRCKLPLMYYYGFVINVRVENWGVTPPLSFLTSRITLGQPT